MKNCVIIFLAGVIIGILACNIISLSTPSTVYGETAGQAGSFIAVTGLCANNYSGLWVLDTQDSKSSPSLCLYIPENGGRGFKLAGARRIKWDLKLIQYNDKTEGKDFTPSLMEKKIKELEEKEAQKAEKEKGKSKSKEED